MSLMSKVGVLIALLSVFALTITTSSASTSTPPAAPSSPLSSCLAACNATYNEANNWCNNYHGWQGGACEELDAILYQCEQACQTQQQHQQRNILKNKKKMMMMMMKVAVADANPWNVVCEACEDNGGVCQFDQNGYSGCQMPKMGKKVSSAAAAATSVNTVVAVVDDNSGCNDTCAANCVNCTGWIWYTCMQDCGCIDAASASAAAATTTTRHVKMSLKKSHRARVTTRPHDGVREVCIGSPWCTPPSPGCAGCQEMGEQCNYDYHGQFIGCM